jgi:DNA-binding NtrC family response regulator
MTRLLVVEDKTSLRELLRRVLTSEGFDVAVVPDAEEAAKQLQESLFEVVITDLRLPGQDGHWVLNEAKRRDPRTEVIVLTAYGSIESSVRAIKDGAFDYLTKPVENDLLVQTVRQALEHRKKGMGGREGRESELLGGSPAFKEALVLAEKAAPSDATILLQGESGTGKELFARFIHQRSKRSEKPFVSLNCGALASTLFESELFGHERGAFTGAVERKPGRFELAGDGTLFLDEVSEIPLESQVKLLRVLQEKEYERVGGTRSLKAEARVLAATNRPLEEAVRQGRFREDLFYRLNVIPLTLPPLRARAGDVELLGRVFLKRFTAEAGKTVDLKESAWEALGRYSWPGNVRELEHCLHRAVILASKTSLDAEDFCLSDPKEEVEDASAGSSLKEASQMAQAQTEKKIISEVLRETGGNKSEAARRLKVSYKTLLTKIKEWGLESDGS